MVSVNRYIHHIHPKEILQEWLRRSIIKKDTSSLDRCSKQSPVSKKITESNNHNSSPLATWAESFIFAGSSALLLLLANFFLHYWYLSLFALIPFLYKITKGTPSESLRMGFLFGISFFAVSLTDSLPISPIGSLLKILLGTGLFAAFGWSASWTQRRWGFNPSIITMLWIGLELGVMKLGVSGGLFERIETSNPFLQSLITLLGFLTVSVIIVFLNSLLVLAIVKTMELTKPKDKSTQEKENGWVFFFTRNLFAEKVYVVPEGRAPPSIPQNCMY